MIFQPAFYPFFFSFFPFNHHHDLLHQHHVLDSCQVLWPTDDGVPYAHAPPPPPVPVQPEMVMGIPKDLLLPASIGALAAVILGVFTISRLTR